MKNICRKGSCLTCGLPPLEMQQEFGKRIEHVQDLRRFQVSEQSSTFDVPFALAPATGISAENCEYGWNC